MVRVQILLYPNINLRIARDRSYKSWILEFHTGYLSIPVTNKGKVEQQQGSRLGNAPVKNTCVNRLEHKEISRSRRWGLLYIGVRA